MLALDLLGAGEGLATQAIVLRVQKIDIDKLKAKLSEGTPCRQCGFVTPPPAWGSAIAPALGLVDQFPKMALDIALPVVKQQLTNLGVTADLGVAQSAPTVRSVNESRATLALGAVLGLATFFGGKWFYRRFGGGRGTVA